MDLFFTTTHSMQKIQYDKTKIFIAGYNSPCLLLQELDYNKTELYNCPYYGNELLSCQCKNMLNGHEFSCREFGDCVPKYNRGCDDIDECNIPCPKNHQCVNTFGKVTCQCLPGATCSREGCPVGKFRSTPDDTACQDCSLGSYSNIVNSSLLYCTPCPEHYTTDGVGSTSVTQCQGQFSKHNNMLVNNNSFLSNKK